MDSRDSLSHEGSRPMLSLGSSSQILSSLSLVSTVINPGQKQTLPKSTYNCRNLSSSSGSSNKDKDPQDSSSGVSLDPFTMAPAPMTSEYSPTHTPCHNCRTLFARHRQTGRLQVHAMPIKGALVREVLDNRRQPSERRYCGHQWAPHT